MSSVYLVIGEDIFQSDRALATLVAAQKKQHGDGVHIERHDAESFTMAACLEAVQNISMWGSHTLVIVRNIDDWEWGKAESLLGYVKSPNPASTLVLQADKVDGRLKAVQALKAACKITECKPLYANQIPDWLRREAHTFNKQLSLEAANWCLELVGTDLATLHRALEGLSLFVGTKPTIDLADVEGFLSNTSQHDVFELCKAMGTGNTARALALMENLMANGEPAVRVMYMIARHWRILLGLRSATDKTASDEMIKRFKLPPFFVGDYQDQARRWDPKRLMRGLSVLARTDRQLKSSRMADHLLTDLALLRL
jgi:DNA polymerase-3 subunit delta